MTRTFPAWFRSALTYGVLGLFGLWCLHKFQADISKIRLSDLHGQWGIVALAGGLSLLNYALRVARWGFYLQRMGHRLPWGFCGMTYLAGFAFTLSPGKVGEMVRARYYQQRQIPLGDVTAAFFAERLMDLIVILLLALGMLAGLPAYRLVMWLGIVLVSLTVMMLLFMPWAKVQTWLDAHPRAEQVHVKALSAAATMLLSARQFLSPGMLLWGFLLGLMAWGAEAVGFKLVGDAISPQAPLLWATAIGIYATATLVGALSFLPGGLGSTEAVMASLLFANGFALPEALLLTLMCRLLTLWLAVVIGWFFVWVLRHDASNRR